MRSLLQQLPKSCPGFFVGSCNQDITVIISDEFEMGKVRLRPDSRGIAKRTGLALQEAANWAREPRRCIYRLGKHIDRLELFCPRHKALLCQPLQRRSRRNRPPLYIPVGPSTTELALRLIPGNIRPR
jgi:hypothetical protein